MPKEAAASFGRVLRTVAVMRAPEWEGAGKPYRIRDAEDV